MCFDAHFEVESLALEAAAARCQIRYILCSPSTKNTCIGTILRAHLLFEHSLHKKYVHERALTHIWKPRALHTQWQRLIAEFRTFSEFATQKIQVYVQFYVHI